jgi:hypothetical protein
MGQDVLVEGYENDGRCLIDNVRAAGAPVALAFWAKFSDRSSSRLYLVSPFPDENGLDDVRHIIASVLQKHPEIAIDPIDVSVLRPRDGLTQSAEELRRSKPFNRPIRVRGGTLGGRDLEEAYIYPPLTPAPTA